MIPKGRVSLIDPYVDVREWDLDDWEKHPEVLEAMEAASGYFVQYDELAEGVGRRLAELTGAEWGLVAAGCAAGHD